MSITLLLVGAGILLVAAAVVATRAVEPALAGENTIVGLGESAEDTLSGGPATAPRPREWNVTALDALADAEDLLDCLEAQGYQERELVILGERSFAVRWR